LPEGFRLDIQSIFNRQYAQAHETYEFLLSLGVAKELARNVLPLGLSTEFIATMNLRSIFNFLSLRLHSSSLLEIRQQASEVANHISKVCPIAFQYWSAARMPDMTDWNDSDPPIPEELQ
jgi:thymidylate synthase (FAD)